MGWLDRYKNADSKSADDQSKAELDAMFERFGAMVDERMRPITENVNALKTEWETIKTEASKPPAPDTRLRDENGNLRQPTEEEKRRALDNALATQNVLTAARLTERDVLDAMPADYRDLIPEIRQLFAQTPVERKAQPDYAEYCQNCADLVIARVAKKSGLRRNPETKEFFLEDKGSGSTTEDSMLADPSLVWHYDSPSGPRTMSAREQLAKLHIDPKTFEESAKKGLV